MNEPMKDFTDPRWTDLIKSFRERVQKDKDYFKFWSTYVKLPEICPQPEFCLISMEPGAGNDCNEPEYRNFIANKGDFILNYCAYHYLGAKGFNYQITDMAKGGLKIKVAKRTQLERYRIWFPLLKDELKLLGNPKIIFIGKGLYDLNIEEKYFPVSEVKYVLHHSRANNRWVNRYFYESIPNDRKHEHPEKIKEKIKEKAVELMEMHNYSKELKDKIIKKEFSREFTDQDKRLLTVYRYDFENFIKST